jgi:Ca2+-transporting ATPase
VSVAWHALEEGAVLDALGGDARVGLSEEEVALRLAKYGRNTLPESGRRSFWQVLLGQFASPLIYLLLLAAAIALAMGHRSDFWVIALVLLLNAVIGAIQEGRAEGSIVALRRLSELQVTVLRAGGLRRVPAAELVPGDVLVLGAGDQVGADARLLEAVGMEVTEAALTGESQPVGKDVEVLPEATEVSERLNLVYAGTHLTRGRGRAVVVATGMETEVGKIARSVLEEKKVGTPLEMRLRRFGHWLAAGALLLLVVVLGLGLSRGIPFAQIFMVAVSQMVSMVPEGLPGAMTIALAVGMRRMARRGALVRRLAAVETLGSTDIICSDKTGTLTRNELTVTVLLLPDGRSMGVTGVGYAPEGGFLFGGVEVDPVKEEALRELLEAAALCNDAHLKAPDSGGATWRAQGDPTEVALLTVAGKGGVEVEALRRRWPRRGEIPFDSGEKRMATEHQDGVLVRVVVKGAPERVLDLCDPSTLEDGAILRVAERFATQALRVLAVAEGRGEDLDCAGGFEGLRGRLRFLGLLGQEDPPREEARLAVEECQRAGIRPVMVTGDHAATGRAIASALGILRPGDLVVDGPTLEGMEEAELRSALGRISVFARVHPSQKLRIVRAFQAGGHVVAMTGDGVNDAAALAASHVGIAMGGSGTEVAKEASQVVLTDDNFATVVMAVQEGRLVYQNLQKVVLFLFATSIDEVLVLVLALGLGLPVPLAAVQILWINVVTEGAVTVNLAMEGLEGDEMRRPPTRLGEGLVTRPMVWRLALMVPCSVLVVLAFFDWRGKSGLPFEQVQTETFTLVAICQWFNALNCRSAVRSVWSMEVFRNGWLVGGLLLAFVLHGLVVYWKPLNGIFYTVPIPAADFARLILLGSIVLWVEELRKWRVRVRFRR